MTREPLKRASDELRKACELVDESDTQDRLYDQSDQLARLAEREREPDHGRLDRHMNALYELAVELDTENEEAASCVRAAREAVTEFRKTVEGV